MLRFIFYFILLLIFKNQVQSSDNYKIVADVGEAYRKNESNYQIKEDIKKLMKYNNSLKLPSHITIKNKRILYINFENYQKITEGSEFNLKLRVQFSTASYPNTIVLPPFTKRKHIDFTWSDCEFGLIFMDSQIDHDKINNSSQQIIVDSAILILLKSTSNRIHYTTIPYFNSTFFLYGCPYKNYLREYSNIEYIPDKYVKDNGIFYLEDKEPSHLFIPIFPKTQNDNFFVCGILRQPTLSDISLGFKIKKDTNGVLKEENGELKKQTTNNCINFSDMFEVRYTYLDENSQLTNEKLFINTRKDNNTYFNQKIYIYNIEKFDRTIFKNSELNSRIFITPSCIMAPQDRNLFITPAVDNLEIVHQNNVRYLFIKDAPSNGNFSAKCISEDIDKNDKSFKNYYTKAAEILILKIDSVNNNKSEGVKSLILLKNNLDSYGEYTCKVVEKIKTLKEKNISIKNVFFLPQNYMKIYLPSLQITYKKDSYPHCKKFYSNIGKLYGIEAINDKRETLGLSGILHSTENFKITKNDVNFNPLNPEYQTTIVCKYKTIAKTNFLTVQKFSIDNILGKGNRISYDNKKNILYPGINISKYFGKIKYNEEKTNIITFNKGARLFFSVPLIILAIVTSVVLLLVAVLVINQLAKNKKIEE